MQFSTVFLALSAFTSTAFAASFTNSNFTDIEAGKPFTITWDDAQNPVTLKLKDGPANVQVYVSTIAQGLTANSYVWTPPADLPDGVYNFEIDDGTAINYSIQFPITGGSTSATSAAASTTGSSASLASSASTSAAQSSSSASKSSSKASSTSPSSTSSTSSAASVPTSNNGAMSQNGSPFALVVLGVLAIAGFN